MIKKFSRDKLFAILILFSMIIFFVGSTFAFFNSTIESGNEDVDVSAINFNIGANISIKYNDRKLVPMNDSDIYIGYDNKCIDIYGLGACHAYTITLTNDGDDVSLSGSIVFNTSNISSNLSYVVFDGDKDSFTSEDIFVDKVSIVSGNTLSLGNDIEILNGESKSYTLFIWLSNIEDKQEEIDGNGTYSASVSYISSNGSRITGTFVG